MKAPPPARPANRSRARPGSAKGFIGPIGDDLPSLIPIIVGLIIFFSSFTFAFNVFDQRNLEASSDRAVLEVARVLQSNGYITGLNDFKRLCASLNIPQIKYLAGITNAYTGPTGAQKIDPFHLDFYSLAVSTDPNDRAPLQCLAPGLGDGFALTPQFLRDKRLLVKVFPLVVEENKIVKPMHLVVVAWK